jgi:hypothetical protein
MANGSALAGVQIGRSCDVGCGSEYWLVSARAITLFFLSEEIVRLENGFCESPSLVEPLGFQVVPI